MIDKTNTGIALGRRTVLQGAVASSAILATSGLVHANGQAITEAEPASQGIAKNIYDLLREGLIAGAKEVPVVGGLLSFLGARILPNSNETTEQMWKRLIEASISDALLRLVQRDLVGLTNVANLYKTAIESGNNATILAQSISANTQFTGAIPGFQIKGEETALLPLFAVAASLHLALMRDMVLKGTEIGLSEAHVARYAKETTELIKQYSAHVDTFAPAAIENARRNNPNGANGAPRNMPLTAMLNAKTDYQIRVIDLRDTWKYLDPTLHPGTSTIVLNREVYTSIIGWWGRSNGTPNVIPAWKPPTSPLTNLQVWDRHQWNSRFIFGFDMTYQDGGAISNGARRDTAHEVQVENYIDRVTAESTSGIFQMRFRNNNGHWTKVGRDRDSSTPTRSFDVAFTGHRLSSIHPVGLGVNAAEGAVSGCVLGFQLINLGAYDFPHLELKEITAKMAPQLRSWIMK